MKRRDALADAHQTIRDLRNQLHAAEQEKQQRLKQGVAIDTSLLAKAAGAAFDNLRKRCEHLELENAKLKAENDEFRSRAEQAVGRLKSRETEFKSAVLSAARAVVTLLDSGKDVQ